MRRDSLAVPGERGSIFVTSLLVLFVLTVVGLSLVLVTETEMLLGSNEQIINETFYAAEAGVAVALGQSTLGLTDKRCFATLAKEEGDEERVIGFEQLGYSVDSTSIYPVAFDVAPYTKANEGRGDVLFAGFFLGSARSRRLFWEAKDPPEGPEETDYAGDIQAEKEIDLAFFVAPIESTIDLRAFDHPEVLGCEPHPVHAELTAVP